MQFQLTNATLMDFARTNQQAMMLIHQGTSDYVGCRCCLLNGVFSGLELGAQAVEKHLKAMLLFAEPNTEVKKFRHKLSLLVTDIQAKGIADLSSHIKTIEKLENHYQARYPDNKRYDNSASTEELVNIDALIGEILDKMQLPLEVLLNSGIYARCIASSDNNVIFPDERWLLSNNTFLQKRVPLLIERKIEWRQHIQDYNLE